MSDSKTPNLPPEIEKLTRYSTCWSRTESLGIKYVDVRRDPDGDLFRRDDVISAVAAMESRILDSKCAYCGRQYPRDATAPMNLFCAGCRQVSFRDMA